MWIGEKSTRAMSDDKDCAINMTNLTAIASTSVDSTTMTLNALDQRISDIL